jgi:hypothetical protein
VESIKGGSKMDTVQLDKEKHLENFIFHLKNAVKKIRNQLIGWIIFTGVFVWILYIAMNKEIVGVILLCIGALIISLVALIRGLINRRRLKKIILNPIRDMKYTDQVLYHLLDYYDEESKFFYQLFDFQYRMENPLLHSLTSKTKKIKIYDLLKRAYSSFEKYKKLH